MIYTSHFNQAGEAHMVDVSDKSITHRFAIAEGYIEMRPETLQIIV
ncbi:MAG: cyclic pyranopterin monophosphate synthase accessory protein, partial [Pseudomonadota bacterium]